MSWMGWCGLTLALKAGGHLWSAALQRPVRLESDPCSFPFPLPSPQLGNEEQQEKLLREWLDCCVTEGGVLVAMQKSSRRRNHPLVTQMVEKWLDRYRQIRPCTSLSDGEEDDDDEDE